MVKGILLLNGEPFNGEIQADGALVYCCDGAYEWAHGKVRIDKNLGDYDSLGYMPEPPPEEIYPSEKNFTDGEIALYKLIENGATEIEIYGGGGGREDHFLGNLQLLYAAHKRGIKAVMHNNGADIFAASGKVELKGYKGKTFSVFPFGGQAHIMESTGLKYAEPPVLHYGECIGVSNVAVSNEAGFVCGQGDCVLIIINRGAV